MNSFILLLIFHFIYNSHLSSNNDVEGLPNYTYYNLPSKWIYIKGTKRAYLDYYYITGYNLYIIL